MQAYQPVDQCVSCVFWFFCARRNSTSPPPVVGVACMSLVRWPDHHHCRLSRSWSDPCTGYPPQRGQQYAHPFPFAAWHVILDHPKISGHTRCQQSCFHPFSCDQLPPASEWSTSNINKCRKFPACASKRPRANWGAPVPCYFNKCCFIMFDQPWTLDTCCMFFVGDKSWTKHWISIPVGC